MSCHRGIFRIPDQLGGYEWRPTVDYTPVRGRVWTATRGQVTPAGEVSVTIDKPDPHEIKDKAILYAFEAKPAEEGGAYLGQFKVTGISGKTLALAPVDRILAPEIQRLEQSQAPWLLCEVIPTDRSWVFAGLNEEQLAKLIPESSRAAYIRNGKAATDTDDPDSVVDVGGEKKFFRPLQDYASAFLGLRKHVAELLDDLVVAKADLDQMNKAVKAADNQVTARDLELASLKAELEKSSKERDLVKTQQAALSARVVALEAEATRLMEENKKLAAAWAAKQLEAAKKMEQLSRVPQTSGVQ